MILFFIHALSKVKKFSLIIKKSESNIIYIVDSAGSTKQIYQWLVNTIRQNNDYISTSNKPVIEEIENDEDSESRHQNQK